MSPVLGFDTALRDKRTLETDYGIPAASGILWHTSDRLTTVDGTVIPVSREFRCRTADGVVHRAATGGKWLWFRCDHDDHDFHRIENAGTESVTCLGCIAYVDTRGACTGRIK